MTRDSSPSGTPGKKILVRESQHKTKNGIQRNGEEGESRRDTGINIIPILAQVGVGPVARHGFIYGKASMIEYRQNLWEVSPQIDKWRDVEKINEPDPEKNQEYGEFGIVIRRAWNSHRIYLPST